MKTRYRFLLLAEVLVCFAPIAALWAMGAILLLSQIATFAVVAGASDSWLQLGIPFALIAAGLVGLIAVAYLVAAVTSTTGIVERPAITLAGIALGVSAIIPPAISDSTFFVVIAILPVVCSVHLLYLARRSVAPIWRSTYTIVAHTASVLLIVGVASAAYRLEKAAVEAAATATEFALPRVVRLSDADRQALDELTDRIALASRESYDSGDWSKFASLYPAGSLECWNASGEDHRFGFLSRRAIPDTARYQIIDRHDYHDGGDLVLNHGALDATHVIMIRFETAAFEGCDLPLRKTWPEEHFFVKRNSNGFELVHPCPSRDTVERGNIAQSWPVASRRQALTLADALSEQQRNELRALVKQDGFALRATGRIATLYGVSEAQATEVLSAVCAKARPPG